MNSLIYYALRFLFVLPAIILHEVAHGYSAYLLGDPTAKRAGRLSLNPLKHIDPVGTVIVPAVLILTVGFGFGWAKPVPVNPSYFKNYRVGFFLTSIAGPATNIVLAAISGFAVRLLGETSFWGDILFQFSLINLVLVFFNLIPIPPLDGSRVIPLFLSDKAMQSYHKVEQYGFGIVMLLVWVLPSFTGLDPVGAYISSTVYPLVYWFSGMMP